MIPLAAIHHLPANVIALGVVASVARGFADPTSRELQRIAREHKAALRSIARLRVEAEAEMDRLVGTTPRRRTRGRGRR
jgi:hypothetical protein